jgi:subtilisin family serine protease
MGSFTLTTRRRLSPRSAVLGVWVLLTATVGSTQIVAPSSRMIASSPYRPDQILVQPKRGVNFGAVARLHTTRQARVLQTFDRLDRLQVVAVPQDETVASLIAKYQQSDLIEFAEPDYVRELSLEPNDPKYLDGTLWALNNYGQNSGSSHADIDATNAWELLTSANNVIVAILDSGVRYTHEDLAANMWTNADGHCGLNAIAGTMDPNDDQGHGTLMAGVMGAVGNNGKGVVGVAWNVRMMACKCFDAGGHGSDSTIISCIDFAQTNGARILSASFSGTGTSDALSNAIYSARSAGIIFVAACGNDSANIDASPRYPACYSIDNIVSVACTTRNDTLGGLSNYGATNVDLAAPGDQIYSTYSASDSYYYPPPYFPINLAGTSYAAAYVSGALALMLAKYPAENHQQIIARLLAATDPLLSLAGKCVTGGRLNLRKALSPPISLIGLLASPAGPVRYQVACDPNRVFIVESTTDLAHWSPVFTNTTSSSGTFDFLDSASTNSSQRFYRVVSTP